MHISQYARHINAFQIDNIIFQTDQTDEAYIITSREISLDENGKASENWVIRGFQLKYIASRAIIYPTSGNQYNTIEANAETAVRQYLNTQLIEVDNNRAYPNLVLSDINLNRGTVRRYDARYEVLSEYISNILAYDNLGWDIILDIQNQRFVFVVLEGIDRTSDNTLNTPVILSTDLRTLRAMNYSQDKVNYYNVAIVAGPKRGDDRIIVEVGNADAATRREIFLEANSIKETFEDGTERPIEDVRRDLIQFGNEFLMNSQQISYASGQMLNKPNLRFKVNYNLGDTVTLQNRNWGVQFDARITSVRKALEGDKEIIENTFDNKPPTIITKLNQQIRNLNNAIEK